MLQLLLTDENEMGMMGCYSLVELAVMRRRETQLLLASAVLIYQATTAHGCLSVCLSVTLDI